MASLSYFHFTQVTDKKRLLNFAAAVPGDGVHQDKVKELNEKIFRKLSLSSSLLMPKK